MEASRIVIRPPGRWPGFGFRELASYRELLYFLTRREILVRYKQSIFGITWVVAQPLAYAFVFAVFFGKLAKIPSEGVPYTVFALAALVPWLFAAQGVSTSSNSLVGEANLLGKIYFPRLALPLAKLMSFLLDLVIGLFVLMLFVLIYGAHPTIGLVAVPGFLAIGFLTVLGVGLTLATLNVKYRDVTVAVPLISQLWLFATPVLYPGALITGTWQYIYAMNPMVSVIEGVRWAFVGTDPPPLGAIAVSIVVAFILFTIGITYFRRAEHYLADII